MSKSAAIVTLSPLKFVPSAPVLAEDLVAIIQAANYAAAFCPEIHGAHFPSQVEPPSPPAPTTQWTPVVHAIYGDDPGNGYAVRADWWFRLDADVQSLRLYAAAIVPVSPDTLDLKLSIDGTDVITLNFTNATNGGPLQGAVNTAAGGGTLTAGDHRGRILIRTGAGSHAYDGTTGLANVPYLAWWSLMDDVIDPATFPSPTEDFVSIDG